MNRNKNLSFIDFNQNYFDTLPQTRQTLYLYSYLSDLEAKSIIIEHNYFDRDYLSEFSAFYSTSTKGYENICSRIHFFSKKISRAQFRNAIKFRKGFPDHRKALDNIQDSYLGFTVKRPIKSAPLGRTVLKWFEDTTLNTPRVTQSSRKYTCHIAGIELFINGLAWQQQDAAVGACATVGLWSMFHSSAFDDHHAIPTTADITRSAHKTASLGKRIFPSGGLTVMQLCEAIKEQGLAPAIIDGDNSIEIANIDNTCVNKLASVFSKTRYSTNCASFLRSGYPVIILGDLISPQVNGTSITEGHAICATGFRDKPSSSIQIDEITFRDSDIEYQYIHDDNIGPNVRFKIDVCPTTNAVILRTNPPPDRDGNARVSSPTLDYPIFVPSILIAATHEDLRTSPNVLLKKGTDTAYKLCRIFNVLLTRAGHAKLGLTVGTRFIKLSDYFDEELANTINASPEILSKTRMALTEKVPPMSLHLGVARIAFEDSTPFVDILYDTTDNNNNDSVYAHVDYSPAASMIIKVLGETLGVEVQAY